MKGKGKYGPGTGAWALWLLLLLNFPLGAQDPVLTLEAVGEALYQSRYSTAEKDAFDSLFKTLEEQELPLEPLFLRWQQGTAKGVNPGQLLAVLKEEQRRLGELGELLDLKGARLGLDRRTGHYLNRFLALSRNGFVPEDLGKLMERAPDGRALDRGSLLLMELNQWGLTRPLALRLTAALLTGPLPPKEYGYLIPLLQRGLSAGFETDILVDEIILYLPRSRDLLELQEYLGL